MSEPVAVPDVVETGMFPSAGNLLGVAAPGTLYHYTDQAGFLGILQSGSLWATAIEYLNDSREYQMGFEIVRRELESRRKLVGDEVVGWVERAIEDAVWSARTVGVVSFSTVKDDLGQWRAYSGGSGGMALGFHGTELMGQLNAGFAALVPVRYCGAEAEEPVARGLCEEMIVAARQLRGTAEDWANFQHRCSVSLQVVCSILKDRAFRAEDEWRAIAVRPSIPRVEMHVRPGRSTIVPYYAMSIRDDQNGRIPITEVVIGPNPHPILAHHAASEALRIAGYADCTAVLSGVPFRNW
jgi:hypothetical protein